MVIDEQLVGLESRPATVRITEERVRRFTEAIGVPFDGTVPPTFVGTLLEAKIPGLELPLHGVIHGEQRFTYHQPVQIGDTVSYTRTIKNVYRRQGKLGLMTLLVIGTKGCDLAGERKFTCSSTIIVPQKIPPHRSSIKGPQQGSQTGESQESPRERMPTGNFKEAPQETPGEAGAVQKLGECRVGEQLPGRTWHPSVLQLRQYAEASGDFNPIHLDDDYARRMGLKGSIAHGMLTMAQLGAMLTDWIGQEGMITHLESRFEGMVYAGEEISFSGVVREREGRTLTCDLAGVNQTGERVISGRAEIVVKE